MMIPIQKYLCGVLLVFLSAINCAYSQPAKSAIASAHPMATSAGFEILQAGGNAFDAAIAVSSTLAVVEPYSSGMGGGGFWLLHRASDKKQIMIDGREKAPLKSHRDMYLDKDGNVVPGLSVNGPLSAGIPGQPAALVHMAKKYGQLPLAKSLAPAIRAAEQGFKVTPYYQKMARFRLEPLQKSSAAAALFLKDNEVPPVGHLIIQQDLANTLRAIAKQGNDGFYKGVIAKQLVKGTQEAGGIWSEKDLAQYRIVERKPLVTNYKGYRITSVAPPSSGGTALIQIFNMLNQFELDKLSSVKRKHVIVEAMRRAYRDRAEFLGDSDFVKVPLDKLTDLEYAKGLITNLDMKQATPSSALKPVVSKDSGFHTSHFSVLDKQGNRVSATLTINYPFGSCFVPPGTGVLLNDEMDDFSAKPGIPNVYGLVGAEANAIVPGKRMLSSMSPSFVENDKQLAIIGTPGGSRIITMVLHGILGFIDGKDAKAIVTQPRYHHQYLPDHIQYEPGALSWYQRWRLKRMGHQLKELKDTYGNMHVVIWDKQKNRISAASDPRGEGMALVR
ncbi:MAG: gamma-glutamyltransferase [Gammaproteobacteria bacterium]|nr:gamma-glutamyltransferase [Gammaproteobacteria bacterium]